MFGWERDALFINLPRQTLVSKLTHLAISFIDSHRRVLLASGRLTDINSRVVAHAATGGMRQKIEKERTIWIFRESYR